MDEEKNIETVGVIEEKIRKQFVSIKVGGKKLLETNIVHSIEVKEKIAYIQLLFSSEQLNSQQQKNLQKKISPALLKLKEIEDVRFTKSASSGSSFKLIFSLTSIL